MPKNLNDEIECALCGAKLDPNESFCPNCGEEVNGNGDDDKDDDDDQQPFKGW